MEPAALSLVKASNTRRQAMRRERSMRSRIWRAGTRIVAVGALATACATGTRASAPGSAPSTPAQAGPVSPAPASAPSAAANSATSPGKPVAPAGPSVDPAAAAQGPQAPPDLQAADQSLTPIQADIPTVGP